MNELSDAHKKTIVRHLIERLQAHTIVLFGSAAKGLLRQDSDIDIAFLSEAQHAPYELFMIAQELADQLKREVDLLDFRQASTVLQAQIVGTGVRLLDARPLERQYAFMRSLKQYALLNEERAPILHKLMQGGNADEYAGHRLEQDGNDREMH